MQQYTKNNDVSSFHGWISSYNDGSQSRIMTTGGIVNSSCSDPVVRMGAPYMGCDCEKVAHVNFRSANVYQTPGMFNAYPSLGLCGQPEYRMTY